MWKLNIPPTIFIININNAPNMEFNINFRIFFIGTINIFPITNKKHIHAKNVIILFVPTKTSPHFYMFMMFLGQIFFFY